MSKSILGGGLGAIEISLVFETGPRLELGPSIDKLSMRVMLLTFIDVWRKAPHEDFPGKPWCVVLVRVW